MPVGWMAACLQCSFCWVLIEAGIPWNAGAAPGRAERKYLAEVKGEKGSHLNQISDTFLFSGWRGRMKAELGCFLSTTSFCRSPAALSVGSEE